MNLIAALLRANDKSRTFLRELDDAEAAVGPQAGLAISRALTQDLIAKTEAAIASGDVLQMLAVAEAQGLGEESEADAAINQEPTE